MCCRSFTLLLQSSDLKFVIVASFLFCFGFFFVCLTAVCPASRGIKRIHSHCMWRECNFTLHDSQATFIVNSTNPPLQPRLLLLMNHFASDSRRCLRKKKLESLLAKTIFEIISKIKCLIVTIVKGRGAMRERRSDEKLHNNCLLGIWAKM